MSETYRVNIINTDPMRDNITIDPLVYKYETADYLDKLMEVLSDELIYMDAGERMTVTITRIS
jgi:hypothetical protein